MAIDLINYEEQARNAVQTFWGNREKAQQKQKEYGKTDQGERSGVTTGKNMDGFLDLVIEIVRANGLAHAEIYQTRQLLTLPGYFRPTKLWDLLVIDQGRLIAALEFKSQVGPSFGNNFNNRAEEAIGAAHDFWISYREGAFGMHSRPFTGWLMLLEDAPKSRTPVKDSASHFPVFKEFRGISYADRYHILCRKLMLEQLYTAASIITSPRSAVHTGEYSEMSDMTGLQAFVSSLAGHIATEAAKT